MKAPFPAFGGKRTIAAQVWRRRITGKGSTATEAVFLGAATPALTYALLTAATTGKDRTRILAGIAEGSVDLVIGTHALVQEGVAFADLSLAVIDEQHRFGVHQRMALSSKGHGVDLLVMTATPLAMVGCGFAFTDAAFVIQWHSVGMFAPSFVTGTLISRFGIVRILLAGAGLLGEGRVGGHEAHELHHAGDAIEVADLALDRRQRPARGPLQGVADP